MSPGEKFPEISRIFRNFPEIFPEFSPGISRISDKGGNQNTAGKLIFFSSKSPEISPGFSGILGNFGNFGISGFPPEKRGKTQKYKHKSEFDPGKNPGKLRGKFPKNPGNFCQDFAHFCQKIPKKCPKITPFYSREIYRNENDANG
jgi:hypothetical protein